MLACIRNSALLSLIVLQPIHVTNADNVVFTGVPTTEQMQALEEQVRGACPKIWEDLGTDIPNGEANIWGLESDPETQDDKNQYLNFISQLIVEAGDEVVYPDDGPESDPLINVSLIRVHCTSARAALLNFFYSNLPQDVVVSMPEITYNPGPAIDGFLVGDLRHTGRQVAAPGWLFLEGQSIGADGSGADLQGIQYYELYEIAKLWVNAGGSEVSWANNDIVTLPDLRGRVIAGGNQQNVGATFGNETNQITLEVNQLPSHNHSISSGGNHIHPINEAGNHGHKLRSSIYEGSTSARSDYNYFEAKARPNYQNTIQGATVNAGQHTHSMPNSGSHSHTAGSTGGGQPVDIAQPSIKFRVEIKYRK